MQTELIEEVWRRFLRSQRMSMQLKIYLIPRKVPRRKVFCRSYAGKGKLIKRRFLREREVVLLLLEGLSNEEIGQYLGISTSSVREYLRRATEKLSIGREELVSMYEEWKKNLET
ncbi:MAG: sigma factor-like helix-turn-helix DNA-binding protein [Aquificaceae bacterium]